MGKYGKMGYQAPPPERPWHVHPIWRGIGCLMVLIGPPVAYAAADLLVEMNLEHGWLPIPRLMRRSFIMPLLGSTGDHILANLLLAAVLLLIGFAIMMVFYTIVYRIVGPPRYGPIDSPPIRRR